MNNTSINCSTCNNLAKELEHIKTLADIRYKRTVKLLLLNKVKINQLINLNDKINEQEGLISMLHKKLETEQSFTKLLELEVKHYQNKK